MGIGVAIGMIAGTTGLQGSARGRMTVLAAVIGLVLGFLATSLLDGSDLAGALLAAAFAGLACAVTSDVVVGASRRKGAGWALSLIVILVAFVLAGLSVLFPPIGLVAAALMIWMAFGRRRRAERKHAGLRILK
jgi:hypothetical protein